ncbi:excalibur calcium-binding domain-containing protein [Streptomyces bobili]|uniref:excalibur calcium-binding domain-containing protein n=1 Tax=Streptomyces bobili TaxID=67280 RepID=UPI00341AE1E7
MAGSGRRGGSVWRARRWWARRGLFGRVVAIALGLLVAFIVLGGLLEACGVSEDEPQEPAPTSSAGTSTPSVPDLSGQPTKETEVTPPAATATVTESETVTEEATPDSAASTASADVYYENCDEARAAGAAPVYAGDPGYGPHLDRDGDGVACEPYVGH